MLKKIAFAVVPMMLLATVAMAEDFQLDIEASDIQAADISFENVSLDADSLDTLANSGNEDAIEACFRSFGYCGYNYWGCYRPCYNYCYHSYYCYRPVYYHCYYPIYSLYWGCY